MNTAILKYSRFPFLVLALLFTILACSGNNTSDPCPPENYVAREYVATGIRLVSVQQRTQNSGVLQIDENTPVPINELELVVSFDIAPQFAETQSSMNLMDWLFKPAYACSIVEPIVSEVVGMDLSSNADLGQDYPPGTSLKSAFFAEVASNIEPYIANFDSESRQLSAYSVEDPSGLSSAYVIKLSLSQEAAAIAPQRSELHRFNYTVLLATGEMFEAVTPAVLIKP